MSWSPVPSAVLVLTLLLGLAGCSGGTEAEVPDGFTVVERDAFSIAVPPDWSVTGEADGRTAVTGPAEDADVPEALVVQVDDSASGDLDALIRAYVEPFRFGSAEAFAEVERTDVQVAGADEAELLEVTYQLPDVEAGTIRDLFLFARREGGPLVFVQLGGPDAVFDRSAYQTVIDSLRIG